jgi:hypothetical protein
MPLRRFIDEHRTQMSNLPLVAFIFGKSFEVPEAAESRFAAALNETLDTGSDAVWVVSRGGQQLPFGTIRAVTATLEWQKDEPIWRNLVADVLFFPAASDVEEDVIATFRQRAAVVIVPLSAPRLQAFGRAATRARIPVVGWAEETNTIEAVGVETLWDLSADPAGDVGAYLAEVATQLTIHDDRRNRFRGLLEQLAGVGSDWPMTTILHADRHRWPRWTIGTLPKLYVRVEDGNSEAYLWRLTYDCARTLPSDVAGELCDGAMVRIAASDDVHEVIAEVDARLQQVRDRHRQVTDAMMFNLFAMALSDLVREWSGNPSRSMIARHVKTLVASVETRRAW